MKNRINSKCATQICSSTTSGSETEAYEISILKQSPESRLKLKLDALEVKVWVDNYNKFKFKFKLRYEDEVIEFLTSTCQD